MTTALIEAVAQATWERCRSLNERKDKATWGGVTEEVREAWRKGAVMDIASLEFVGWLCPCHRRVVRANEDGSKPDYHLISKDEGTLRCNISPDLWQETYVRHG
jgi:hypothetical protein